VAAACRGSGTVDEVAVAGGIGYQGVLQRHSVQVCPDTGPRDPGWWLVKVTSTVTGPEPRESIAPTAETTWTPESRLS
jgi:hypothetical protein